jgi:hypothetical protein
MMTKHNKKRNVGLVYEMLLQYITENVMDNNHEKAKEAVNIIERRFKKGTELYKEFRLFNALATSTVSGTHVAAGILAEAKDATRRIDLIKLRKEKSHLIKDINYKLNESNFFYRRINNFKDYATIQVLMNEWKAKDSGDLSKTIEYEKILTEKLIRENSPNPSINHDERSDKLVFKVMSEKINEKYKSNLLTEQKDVIRNYAIYSKDTLGLKVYLDSVKRKTIKKLNEYKEETQNKIILSKIGNVVDNVSNLKTENVNDDTIIKYLTIINLKEELTRGDNE